jgi:hypothetical protein
MLEEIKQIYFLKCGRVIKKKKKRERVMIHACNPSTQEAEAGGLRV